ncbi:MAG: glycosyltransferase family 2 protein [Planctomycetota bacterium]
MPDYLAAVAISTHNRKDELKTAVDSCLAQSLGERLQVVVVDDGSTDGTSEMLRATYGHLPNVRLDAKHPGIGLIGERNRFPELCDAPVIVSMDDDAIFESKHTVEQTLADFEGASVKEAEGRVAAVAIPYIDVNIRPGVVQQSPPAHDDGPGRLYAAEQYRGTAHAILKEPFIRVGRYRAQLFRQGEEQDLSIRLYNAGYVVVLGTADPIHHLESPKRSKPAIYRFTARNNLWFAWHNVPKPAFAKHALGGALNLLVDGLTHPGRLFPRVEGVWQGFGGMLGSQRAERDPVSMAAYRLFRRLRKGGPVPIEDVLDELPPLES